MMIDNVGSSPRLNIFLIPLKRIRERIADRNTQPFVPTRLPHNLRAAIMEIHNLSSRLLGVSQFLWEGLIQQPDC